MRDKVAIMVGERNAELLRLVRQRFKGERDIAEL